MYYRRRKGDRNNERKNGEVLFLLYKKGHCNAENEEITEECLHNFLLQVFYAKTTNKNQNKY